MKKLCLSAAICLAVSTLFIPESCGGEVLLSLSKPNDFAQTKFIRLRKDGAMLIRRNDLRGRKKIPVSPKKRYRVSCDIRSLSDAAVKVRIGIVPWYRKVPACMSGIMPVKGTETELVRPCRPGDKVIYLKDCAKWQQCASCIAFDVDPDGLLRDIPTNDIINGQAIKWTRSGDCWEVTVNQPVQVALEKGVCVRQHIAGNPAICSPEKEISSALQSIDFIIGPGIAAGAEDLNKLFKGVTHATFFMQTSGRILVKNIKIEEI